MIMTEADLETSVVKRLLPKTPAPGSRASK